MEGPWVAKLRGLLPSKDLPLERQFFQGVCLLTAVLALFVVLPANSLQHLSPWLNLGVFIFGLISLAIYLSARRGRDLPHAFFFSLILCLDLIWFANGGSQGSIGLFYFAATLFAVVFFRGSFRVVMVLFIPLNVIALHLLEWHWPGLAHAFQSSGDRLLDLITGYVLSILCCVMFQWVILESYERERTKLKAALHSLGASEAKFLSVFHENPDALLILDRATGQIIDANPGFERFSGYTREAVLGKTTLEAGFWKNCAERDQLLATLAEGGTVSRFEAELVRPDGTPVWGEIYLAPLEFDGRACMLSTTRDITPRRKAEMELRKVSTALAQSPTAVVITDREGRIEYTNAAFTLSSGYEPSEVIGERPNLWRSGEHSAAFYQELWDTILEGRVWKGHFHNRAKNGSLYWERATISPILDADNRITGFVGAKEDITESLRAEAERRHLEDLVQQAQKMDSLGSLAGGVAHDFNNMLSGIMGYADLLLETEGDPRRREHLQAILSAATRSGELTRKLLAFGRRGKNLAESVDLKAAIQDCLAMLRPSIPAAVAVELTLEEGLCIDGDPTQIHQVLVNLCINAVEAMPGQGTLKLSTRLRTLKAAQAQELRLAPGAYVELKVVDTGMGMTEEVRKQVFEPFFTTKTATGSMGTGLGLSTVYGIIQAHHGTLDVASILGRGTTFHILLPQGTLPPREGAALPSVLKGQGTVLVVEDEPLLRELATAALEGLGFATLSAANGQEGVAVFQERHLELHAVLLDLKMPVLDGKEAFQQLHRINPKVPVVVCTGYGENEEVQTLITQGAAGMLAKPYRIAELAAVMQGFGARNTTAPELPNPGAE